ncbi:MAG: phosphoglucosamine mutase [bacterium]
MNKSVKFGTDGIRGHADYFPFENKALISLGLAIAKWGIEKYKKTPTVLIGHDTRISCEKIKHQLEKGLLHFGLSILDVKVLPTPAICKLANHYNNKIDCGIIISASHNPYYDNGIKLVDAKTGKLKSEDEEKIENYFKEYFENIDKLKTQNIGNIKIWDESQEEYKKIITSMFDTNFLTNKKIILDCANGSTYKIAPEIFDALGAKVIAINNEPTGKNINKNCGTLHTQILEKEIIKNNADIGFAFDGDGDRVIAVNKFGQTIDGDQIIAILTKHPQAKDHKTIVGTIMTNLGLDIYLKEKKINLIRTNVGDKYVAAELIKNNLFLGGENSGHIIMMDYLSTGDGIFTALRVAEMAILENDWTLKSFNKTPQVLINVPIKQKKKT